MALRSISKPSLGAKNEAVLRSAKPFVTRSVTSSLLTIHSNAIIAVLGIISKRKVGADLSWPRQKRNKAIGYPAGR